VSVLVERTASLLFPGWAGAGDRSVLRVGEEALGARELWARAASHAAALAASGVRPGDRVAVWTRPEIGTVVALIANAAWGFVTVPLNPALGTTERDHILRDAAPRQVLDLARDASPRAPPHHEPDPDAPLLVLYTSGTTGAPKGAVLTAKNVIANLDALARAWAWTREDAIVHALPLFHVHGLVLGLFGAARTGASLCWVPKFDVGALAGAIATEGERAVLFAVPTMYHRLVEAAERDAAVSDALGRARLLVSGSAALSLREHARIERATGRRVLERYGLTETLILTAVRHDDPPCPGSVGRALEGVELRLVDDARADVADGIGEIAVRGPNVFAGYLNRPEATAAVRDAGGWFYTGDLATRDAAGLVRIVGRRATDLIKTGGFKVGAGEIEAALLEHPGVRECAVAGLPDDDLGERIVAWVVAADPEHPPPERELADHVAAALAPHKRPRAIRFLDALPRNAMGKVQKGKLPR
jgi:malonyl-CoA/methylmalonyl-CoA synthetase